MFGYVKLDKNAPKYLADNYRKHYCFLCHCMKKYYGQISRILTSFDVTFFALLAFDDGDTKDVTKIKCFGNKSKDLQRALSTQQAHKIATLNMALVCAELDDNILDGDKPICKVVKWLLQGKFNKAQKAYPNMWQDVMQGYAQMRTIEQNNGSMDSVENCFAELIEKVSANYFDITDEAKLQVIKAVCKCIFFFDMVDDLDKDVKKGAFNPLKTFGNKKQLVVNNYKYVNDHMHGIISNVLPLPTTLNCTTALRIAVNGMPEKLLDITKEKLL